MVNELRNKAFSNMIWRFMERSGAQAVSFVVQIILARLIAPKAFGIIALVVVFTSILQVFVDSGMGNALIQKKDADDLDFSSVFYFNMAMCLALYGMMFIAAPFIADFYNMPDLTTVVRVLSLMLVISGVRNIQQAYVSRHLMFKRFFYATLGGTIGAAIVGVSMAYAGYGVWAIVAQQLFRAGVAAIILWFTVKWHPKLIFSFERLKGLFSYGWKLLVSSLITTVYNEIRQLIIGKVYLPEELAFYNRSGHFPRFIVKNINSSIDSVLLPTMSAEQDDKSRVRAMTRRAIKTSTYLMMPLMVGLAVCAEPVVRLVLTEKWLPCVPFLRVFCFVYAFQPIQTANLNAIKALGRSDLFLKLEIIKKIIGLTAMFATIFISIEAMVYSYLVTTVLAMCINAYPNKTLLTYSIKDQVLDMLPTIEVACTMAIPCYMISLLGLGDVVTLVIQILTGVVCYIGLSKLFKLEAMSYLSDMSKSLLSKFLPK